MLHVFGSCDLRTFLLRQASPHITASLLDHLVKMGAIWHSRLAQYDAPVYYYNYRMTCQTPFVPTDRSRYQPKMREFKYGFVLDGYRGHGAETALVYADPTFERFDSGDRNHRAVKQYIKDLTIHVSLDFLNKIVSGTIQGLKWHSLMIR